MAKSPKHNNVFLVLLGAAIGLLASSVIIMGLGELTKLGS